MLRSFDYLAASAYLFGGAGQRDTAQVRKHQIIEHFLQVSEKAFSSAYSQASKSISHQWSTSESARTLLDLFLMEKAAYEINYEAANRPTWLPVALRGLAGLAARLLPDWSTDTTSPAGERPLGDRERP